MDSNQQLSLITSVASIFKVQLENYKQWDKGPKQLRVNWESVSNAQEDTVEKTILKEGGRPTWFIYSVIKSLTDKSSNHFAGRPSCEQLFKQLNSRDLPLEDRTHLALQLAHQVKVLVPTELQGKVEALFRKRIRSPEDGRMSEQSHAQKKRRRCKESL